MNFQEYPDREILMMDLADRISSELKGHLLTNDRATLCIPGGSTPGPAFDILSGVRLPWDRISVMLNDERWVPEDSPRSNTRLVRERLLTEHAAAAQMVPLHADVPTPEEGLGALSDDVEAHLPITVLLLGMGTDGHTASLFPGADQLEAAFAPDAPALMAMRAEGADEPRITLSARALRTAMSTHVLITGAEKREVLEAAAKKPELEAPIRGFLGAATVHWAA
ncbi:6-phosphogluconolactonase [Roseicyclus sp. F158]|uniref:6-phosphogluconolactonase n=1 Tax=Tropicimonas omnivorans TaxID=3075590 RepID=A0ABU3DK68_9RHOB|nr:6-phosphogluconolactonase [Roseicyclus sp. F158]MDT0683983.1 6-phosphogluconolactonase [Roseicyclus sp. F158]